MRYVIEIQGVYDMMFFPINEGPHHEHPGIVSWSGFSPSAWTQSYRWMRHVNMNGAYWRLMFGPE